MLLSKAVRVAKTGNSRALPVPADVVRELGVEVGDSYAIEITDERIIYSRVQRSTAAITGEGARRVAVVPAGRAVPIMGRSSMAALDDWDF